MKTKETYIEIGVWDQGVMDERQRILKLALKPSEKLLRMCASAAAHALGKHSSIQDVARAAAVLRTFAEKIGR